MVGHSSLHIILKISHLHITEFGNFDDTLLQSLTVWLHISLEGEVLHIPLTNQFLHHGDGLALNHVQSTVIGSQPFVQIMKTLQQESTPVYTANMEKHSWE